MIVFFLFFFGGDIVAKEDYEKWRKIARSAIESKPVKNSMVINCLQESFTNRNMLKDDLNKSRKRMVFSILKDWPALKYGEFVSE